VRRKDKKRLQEAYRITGMLLDILASVNEGYVCRCLQKYEVHCKLNVEVSE